MSNADQSESSSTSKKNLNSRKTVGAVAPDSWHGGGPFGSGPQSFQITRGSYNDHKQVKINYNPERFEKAQETISK